MAEKLMRIRLFDVAEDGTETEHINESGEVLIDEEHGLCTGFCLVALNEQTTEAEGKVYIHNLSLAELCTLMANNPITAKASILTAAFSASQRLKKEADEDASE